MKTWRGVQKYDSILSVMKIRDLVLMFVQETDKWALY